jgi:fructokinase
VAHKVISFGDMLWDLFPEGPMFGGAPGNYACHAARLGGEVYMVSGVGAGQRGTEALAVLRAQGVRDELVQRMDDYPTGIVTVEVDDGGKPTFEIGKDAAWDHWEWNGGIEKAVRTANAVYFGTLGQRGESPRAGIRKAMQLAKDEGILRVLDVNLRPPFFTDALIRDSLALASVFKLSDDELQRVCSACGIPLSRANEDTLREILEKYELEIVVMTKGDEGAVLLTPDTEFEQPGVEAEVVDTVGAGDSFTASMTLGLLRKDPFPKILRDACEVAAAVCSHAGAVPE